MVTFLTVVHVIVSLFLILVVLLQQGKGQDIAGAFGGGGSQANVGARSATTVLHRLTTVAAVMFMFTSLGLAILISNPGSNSVISQEAAPGETEPAPTDSSQPNGEVSSEPEVEINDELDEGVERNSEPEP